MNKSRIKFSIIAIIILGALLRLLGITYGLPLWLVGDEPSLIFGALKMLELKTLLPASHASEFIGTLYYTPYLPYLYLLLFVPYAAAKWFIFSGTFTEFRTWLAADVSGFFVLARLWSVAFGTITIWYVYRLGQAFFKREFAALLSALVFSVSFLPVSYSHWARHWMPVTGFFAAIMWYLVRSDWPLSRRFFWALFLTGIGVGVNVQIAFVGVFILLYLVWVEKVSVRAICRARWFYGALGVFVAMVGAAYLIWPRGFDFIFIRPLSTTTPLGEAAASAALDVPAHKTATGLLQSFAFYAGNIWKTETVFFILALLGLLLGLRRHSKLTLVFILFGSLYVALFYFRFAVVDRYILVLYPIFALLSGLGLAWVYDVCAQLLGAKFSYNKIASNAIIGTIVLFLALPALRLDYLLIKNDTRLAAADWIGKNAADGAKIALVAPLMRLPAEPAARAELLALDANSLRAVDRAEAKLQESGRLVSKHYVLNAYTVRNPDFFFELPKYLKDNGYDYLVVSPKFLADKAAEKTRSNRAIALPGETLYTISGSYNYELSPGHQAIPDGYGAGWRELFFSERLGPEIFIQKL